MCKTLGLKTKHLSDMKKYGEILRCLKSDEIVDICWYETCFWDFTAMFSFFNI